MALQGQIFSGLLPKGKLFMESQIQQLLDSHLSRWSEDEQYIMDSPLFDICINLDNAQFDSDRLALLERAENTG